MLSYTIEIRNNDNVSKQVIDTNINLKETKDGYIASGDIIEEFENDNNDKHQRYICFNLNKPLILKGNLIVNGYVNSDFPLKVTGLYKVGDRYESNN